MAGMVFDRRNWVFVAALVPAMLVALFASLPVGKQPLVTSSRSATAPAATTSAPAPAELLHAPPPTIVPARPDFSVSTMLQLDGPLHPGDYVWDDTDVPDGRVAIVADLNAELLYVYRGGQEIGRSTLIYGDDDKPTPIGVFPIMEKKADHYSSTYWGAPMPHMLRLTRDGVAVHGSDYINPVYATHGCIGLPRAFAALLFRQAMPGDYVKITHHWNPGA